MAKFVFSVTRELTSESPIDSCQEELSPSDPIESVCLLFQPPSLLLTVTSATTDQRPYTHFRFQSRSDSIRPRVKTTRLRSSVLDMYDNLWLWTITTATSRALTIISDSNLDPAKTEIRQDSRLQSHSAASNSVIKSRTALDLRSSDARGA